MSSYSAIWRGVYLVPTTGRHRHLLGILLSPSQFGVCGEIPGLGFRAPSPNPTYNQIRPLELNYPALEKVEGIRIHVSLGECNSQSFSTSQSETGVQGLGFSLHLNPNLWASFPGLFSDGGDAGLKLLGLEFCYGILKGGWFKEGGY